MSDKVYNVLFLCTGNSARSIMAEALMNTMGHGRFRGFSAGSFPTGVVHPLALEQIRETTYPLQNLRSKSWNEFTAADAPQMDFIITVCDDAAGEVCPVWPGHPLTAHWEFADPALADGNDEAQRAAFHHVFRQIMGCVSNFVALPLPMLEKNAIHHAITALNPEAQSVSVE